MCFGWLAQLASPDRSSSGNDRLSMIILVLGMRGGGERHVLRGQLRDLLVQLGGCAIVQGLLSRHAVRNPFLECRVVPPHDGTDEGKDEQQLDEPLTGMQEFQAGANRAHGVSLR